MFWLLLNSVCTVSLLSSYSALPAASSMGEGRKSGRKMARTAHPNYAKGYFMLSGVMLSNRNRLSKKCLPVGMFSHTTCCCLETGCTLGSLWDMWLFLQGFSPSSLTKLSLTWPAGLPTFALPVLSLVLLGVLVSQPWVLSWVNPPQPFPSTDRESPTYFSYFLTTSPANKETYP